jgi:signal transduction histidine kinase/CheY-like chemotaxis protein
VDPKAAKIATTVGALLALAGPVRLRAEEPFRIGYWNMPPNMLMLADERPTGLAYDVVSRAAARAKVPLRWIHTPAGPDEAFANGRIDLWPLMARLPERERLIYFTRPWRYDLHGLVTRSGDGLRAANFSARRLAAIDSRFTRYFLDLEFPKARLLPVKSQSDAVEAVCLGNADGAITYVNPRPVEPVVFRERCRELSLDLEIITVNGARYGLGASANSPQAIAAAEKISAEIDTMRREGSLTGAFLKWLGAAGIEYLVLAEAEERQRSLWVALALIVALLGIIGFLAHLVQSVRKARIAAEEATRAKDEFLAVMSHEIRTPLNGVLGMAELLRDSPLTPDQKEMASTMRSSASTLLAQVNDLLDYSRLESGHLRLAEVPFDLWQALEDSMALQRLAAQQRGLDLRVVIAPGVPQWIQGDPDRLRQVVGNLASNAVKFTERGSVTLQAASEGPGLVKIEVEDTGIGIPAGKLQDVFKKFTQVDSSFKRRHQGAGLGLAIVQRLVHAMGGTVALRSEFGVGTTVTVRLPLRSSAAPPVADPKPDPVARQLRILLVEDNAVNQKVARRMLQKLGVDPEVAADGREALERFQRDGPWDLIFMDCAMPEMDGFEATRRIRAGEPPERHTPILALTANVFESDRERCLAAGMDGLVAKPVSLQSLRDALTAWAGQAQAQAE